MAAKKPALIVRTIDDGKEVHRVELSSLSERYVERVLSGMMNRVDLERFYIDDSEVDAARKALEVSA